MYFPQAAQKTYPNNDNDTRTAKLEGLARTLFVAAPLLRRTPTSLSTAYAWPTTTTISS